MYRTRKPHRIKQAGASLAVAAGLVAGGAVVASAATSASTPVTSAPHAFADEHRNSFGHMDAPGRPGDRLAGGVVEKVSADSLTVTTPTGAAQTFTLNSATVVEKGHSSAALSDVAVGENVRVVPSAPGSSTAARVDIMVPHVAGKVVSVNASSIVVSDRDGFYRTIAVDSTTTYMKNSSAATAADVTVGSFIAAEGSVDANHTTLDATSVGIGLPSATPPPMP